MPGPLPIRMILIKFDPCLSIASYSRPSYYSALQLNPRAQASGYTYTWLA